MRKEFHQYQTQNILKILSYFSSEQAKNPCKSRLFPVDLDAPCMDLERIFILKVIKNHEI